MIINNNTNISFGTKIGKNAQLAILQRNSKKPLTNEEFNKLKSLVNDKNQATIELNDTAYIELQTPTKDLTINEMITLDDLVKFAKSGKDVLSYKAQIFFDAINHISSDLIEKSLSKFEKAQGGFFDKKFNSFLTKKLKPAKKEYAKEKYPTTLPFDQYENMKSMENKLFDLFANQ